MESSDHGTTRRSFVTRTATLVGGVLVWRERPGGLYAQRRPRPLGVALVGLGNLSTNQLAPALQKTTNCRLAGIVTGTPAKAVRWKAEYDIPDRSIYDYATMGRMADNDDIDIAYIVTPNGLHGEHTIASLRAGKHVLCEKPMEVSVERCAAMIAEAKAAGRQLAIGYRCQFDPHHLELVRLARERILGAVKMVEAGFGFSIGDPNQWRLDRELAGGGPLMDVGIYALQSARMITGEEPTHVSALRTVTDPAKFDEVEESMTFQLGFRDGVLSDCRTSYRVRGMNRVTAFAERGSFGMDPAYNYGGNRGWRSDGQPLAFEEIDMFAAELDDFASCIMNGTPTRVPGEEGLRDVSIMLAAYEAARTRRTVTLR
jgi:predicted dehydrogenase